MTWSAASDPRRILIVRLSHLGDVVHALPVYHALRAQFSTAEIGWAVQTEFAELVSGLPGIARVIEFERRGGARAWTDLASRLALFAPNWAVDAQGNLKSAAVTLVSRAPRRSGLARVDWAEPWGSIASTDRAAPARAAAGLVAHALDKTRALVSHVAPRADLWRTDAGLTEAERAWGRSDLTRLLGFAARAPAVLHLGAPSDVRSWPVEGFGALARMLAADRPVVIVSGPSEARAGLALERAAGGRPGIAYWTGQRGLRALAAFCAAAAELDGVFVGADSGPLHLAAASGLRVVALAGPQDAARTGPWPVPDPNAAAFHAVVRAARSPECAPCLRRSCAHVEGPVCMTAIDPADVALAVNRPAASRAT